MQKLLGISLSLLFAFQYSVSAAVTADYCQDLDKKIEDTQVMQGNYRINEKSSVKDYVRRMDLLQKSLIYFEILHKGIMAIPGVFHIEDFLKDSIKDQQTLKMLSIISPNCADLSDKEKQDTCSETLLSFQKKKTFKEQKNNITDEHERLFAQLQLTYEEPKFNQMSIIAKYLAAQHLNHCSEVKENETNIVDANQDLNCNVMVPMKLETLSINSMEIVRHYLIEKQNFTEKDLKKSCVSLMNDGYSPLACSGVACQDNHEYIAGNCLQKCTKLEIRSAQKPYGCFPDEQAQLAKNQRIQKSKAGWGKVLRTSAVIVVAGGAIAGTAYLLQQIYKDKSLITYNDHPSYYNYNSSYSTNYNSTTTTSTPNTPYYNYNPYPSYNYNSYPGSQYGYNPYFMQSYDPYGQQAYNPYGTGTGLGSGAWGGGFAF